MLDRTTPPEPRSARSTIVLLDFSVNTSKRQITTGKSACTIKDCSAIHSIFPFDLGHNRFTKGVELKEVSVNDQKKRAVHGLAK